MHKCACVNTKVYIYFTPEFHEIFQKYQYLRIILQHIILDKTFLDFINFIVDVFIVYFVVKLKKAVSIFLLCKLERYFKFHTIGCISYKNKAIFQLLKRQRWVIVDGRIFNIGKSFAINKGILCYLLVYKYLKQSIKHPSLTGITYSEDM